MTASPDAPKPATYRLVIETDRPIPALRLAEYARDLATMLGTDPEKISVEHGPPTNSRDLLDMAAALEATRAFDR